MRQVIRGKAYDTGTATEIARGDHGEDGESVGSQACWILFQTQGGAFLRPHRIMTVRRNRLGPSVGPTPSVGCKVMLPASLRNILAKSQKPELVQPPES
jgi:hypothetical protein